jgi:hypothetical protein
MGLAVALLFVSCLFSLWASSARAAGDANTEACPNEALPGFRGYLPDCRAYEMVSSPFKDGQPPNVVWAVSSDGSRMLDESLGAFASAESDSENGAVYEFRRLESGWVTSAVSPSASVFPTDVFLSASADLSSTLWAMRSSSQSIYAEDIYVRQPDGLFLKVGPMVPPSAEPGPPPGGHNLLPEGHIYAGASSDLSHVLFEIRASSALWPGDTTAESTATSLYEYVGTENKQPQLVGIDAEGHLISNCGTTLGYFAGEFEAYNASSANGETVFFTSLGHNVSGCEAGVAAPGASELYARLHQIEPVPISEPTTGQCAECNTTIKTPAEFQGASEDGSKVFFLTEQELFSGDTTMNLYEYDFSNRKGQKVVRVSRGAAPEVQGVARVAEDGSHAYFVARGVLTEGKNAEGREPTGGGDNLYVFERDAAHPGGQLAFVATLANADSSDWSAQDIRPVQSTPDGRFLVFESVADLTPGDTSTVPQVFEYDARERKLVRVSIGQAGYTNGTTSANANASRIPSQLYSESRPTTAKTGLAVSTDGSYVVFGSAGALTPSAEEAAAAGAESVYEYHSVSSIANGNVYLISDGRNLLSAEKFGIDASGSDVFFQTADPLLPQDLDTQFDVYDARSGGGFAAPATSTACEGEACQGPASVQEPLAAPGSTSVLGSANALPPPTGPAANPKSKPLSRAERLARALKACKREPRRKRAACERQAKRRYGSKPHASAKGKR